METFFFVLVSSHMTYDGLNDPCEPSAQKLIRDQASGLVGGAELWLCDVLTDGTVRTSLIDPDDLWELLLCGSQNPP